MEMLVAGAVCGLLYALFAGQPLTIVGATGPMLVFESIVFRTCKYEIYLSIFINVHCVVMYTVDIGYNAIHRVN